MNQSVVPPVQEQSQAIRCADGCELSATVLRSAGAQSAVVIAPALAVTQRFYLPYARWLAARGFHVVVFDYRGFAASARAARNATIEDWVRDLDAVFAYALNELAPRRLFLVGHSLGAQIPGLVPLSERLAGIVMVAGTAPHVSRYPRRARPGLRLLWNLMIPVLTLGRARVSARWFGVGKGDVPAGALRQWAAWARSPGYLFDPRHGLDTTRYARLTQPVLAYSFDDDAYASVAASEALLHHYPAARIDRRRLDPREIGAGPIGHFGYFSERLKDTLWPQTADWLQAL